MLPIADTAVSLELASIWNAASRIAPLHDVEHPCVVLAADSGDQSTSDKKDDLVVTPGGPRPRDQTHHVGPGETIRRNDDGTFTVVPKDGSAEPGSEDAPDKKQK